MKISSQLRRRWYQLACIAVATTLVTTAFVDAHAESPGVRVGALTDAHFQIADSEPLTVRGQSCSAYGSIGDRCSAAGTCCQCEPMPLSSLVVFTGMDSFGNKGDDNGANNFGVRTAINYGRAIGDDGWGVQIGAAYGIYDSHGRDNRPGVMSATNREHQIFTTVGIFRRSDVDAGRIFSYGIAYDYQHDNTWGEEANPIDLHQIRGQIGMAINQRSELGAQTNLRLNSDRITIGGVANAGSINAMDQVSLYWQRNWELGATTVAYFGLSDDPGMFNVGFRADAPLNDKWALYGTGHYVLPSSAIGDTNPNGVANSFSEQTWNVQVGVARYFGGRSGARNISGNASMPYLPVADNGSFPVSAPTGEL